MKITGNFQRAIVKLKVNPGAKNSYAAYLTPSEIWILLQKGAKFSQGSTWDRWEQMHRARIQESIDAGISNPQWYYLLLSEEILKYV